MASSNQALDVTSTIDIDPSGDVLLRAGHHGQRKTLLVSSKVLSLASPVFAAMFGPNFEEGNGLNSTNDLEIPLPEDDPASMLLLCNCLHLRSEKIPVEVRFTDLKSFALLCDKYDCTKAVSAWTELWLRKWETKSFNQGFEALMLLIFTLDSPVTFNNISKRAIFHQVGSFNVRSAVEETTMAQDVLIEALERRRSVAMSELQKAIERLAAPTLDKCINGRRGSLCPFRASSTHSYFRGLRDCGLWPFSAAFCETSLSIILDKMSSFQETNDELQTTNYRMTSCDCEVCSIRFKPVFEKIRQGILSVVKGLCLDCVKSEYLGLKQTCRIKHHAVNDS